MKIKRLFAALLSAMMIVSAFSFTANAQETQTVTSPVVSQTAKASAVTFRNSSGLTKTRLYDAVNDKIFYRFNPVVSSSDGTHLDAHGLPKVTVTNGVSYLAYDIRSNYPVVPSITLYNSTDTSGGKTYNDKKFTAAAIKGDGSWERVIIEISGETLASFTQNHMFIFGRSYHPATNAPSDAYVDIAAFGYFNDEYSAENYDFGTAVAADGAVSFDVEGTVSETAPTEDPEAEGEIFMGWNADSTAVRGAELTALATVPESDTTYYAIFTGEVEDETAVYVSAADGNDENSGRHSKRAVATLTKAKELLATEGIDTLYVIGSGALTTKDTNYTSFGVSGKTIKVKGYNGSTDIFDVSNNHLSHVGPVDYDNITISLGSDDGQFIAQGHDITIGSNVATTNGKISQFYYGDKGTPVYGSSETNPADSTLTLKGGSWDPVHLGYWTSGTFYGKSTVVVDGATVGTVKLGHGSGSTQTFRGTANLILNSGTVTAVNFDSAVDSAVNSYSGLRYITLNGGKVTGDMTVTSKDASSSGTESTATGVTVVEINAPDILAGYVKQGAADDVDASRVVIYNNDSYLEDQVTDESAIVLDVTGAEVHADVTVADDYTATLNGFTYELAYNYYDTVKIGETEYELADYETLPATLFTAGVNTVEFFEAETTPLTAVYVSADGDDSNKGDTTDAPVKTMGKVRELLDAEDSVLSTVYIIGTVELTVDDATNIKYKNDGTVNGYSYEFGVSGRTVKYLGYGENAILDAKPMPVYLAGDVEIDNFFFQQQTTYDGKLMTEGNDIVIGENMSFGGYDKAPSEFTYSGTSTRLTNFYYALKGNVSGSIPNPLNSTITMNGGKIAILAPVIYSGNATFNGEVTVNLNKKADVGDLKLGGHGSSNTVNTYGSIVVNVNDEASVTSILSEITNAQSIGNYSGLREININGGTVGTIKTTAKAANSTGTKTATTREQLMVITVNGGKVNTITKPVDDEDEKSQVAVIFNDGVDAVEYTDSEAYILDVTGATVAADTTVSEDKTSATLNKFTYTVKDESYDIVTITAGDTSTTYKLAELGGEIALDKLTVGTSNAVVFSKYVEAPTTANAVFNANGGAWANGDTTKTVETTIGETPAAPAENPVYDGYVFDGWTPALAAMTADGATYTAEWKKLLTPDEVKIVEAPTDETGIPANATFIAAASVTADSDGVAINASGTAGDYGSATKYFDSNDYANTVVWYKNSGYIPYYTGLAAGTYNVTYRLHLKTNSNGVRGFSTDIDGKLAGTVHVSGTTSTEASSVYTSETFVTFKNVELTENALIKYSVVGGFDNNTVKGGDLIGIYVWQDAPAVVNNKVYLGDAGSDDYDGLTAEAPVKTLAKAQEIITSNEAIDTLVIVNAYTTCVQFNTLGAAGRTITVTGDTAEAVYSLDWPKENHPWETDSNGNQVQKNTDDTLTLTGPVIFKNITLAGDNNDGRIKTQGHKIVMGESVAISGKNPNIAVEENSANAEIEIVSGSYDRVFPGRFSGGTYTGNTTITISGDSTGVATLGLGHGWNQKQYFAGTLNAVINGGSVSTISLQSTGSPNNADNGYKGLRYYTINGGTVGSIVTTSSPVTKDNSTSAFTNVAYRTGVTVFEINKADAVTGTIDRGINISSKEKADDDATRIVIFNNGSYADGKVLDEGAITVDVNNGAIKADVTVAEDYTTTLNGYTFTTDKAKVYINGTNYNVSTFTSEAALAGEEVSGMIPKNYLNAGTNAVIFTDAALATVKFIVNGETTEELLEVGSAVTFPTAARPATKDYYYSFEAWSDGTTKVDTATYTVPAGGVTLTAVFTGYEMPDSASREYVAGEINQVENVEGVFTAEAATIDGVDAVKVIPGADGNAETTAVNIEGAGKYPYNYSTGENSTILDPAIYEYAVIKYYYVPGTNTDTRELYMWYQKHPWEDDKLYAISGEAFTMEAGKWTYLVDKLDRTDDIEPDISSQFHIRPAKDIMASTLNANGEYFYINGMYLFKSAPTVATVTFQDEDGTVLYAVDALNSEAVIFRGTEPAKDNYTFKGWAKEGTTAVVEEFKFAEDTTLVPVFEEIPAEPEETAIYNTYGTYNNVDGTYTIDVKFTGNKINAGAFGLTFNSDYMTYDKNAADAFTLATGISNYLDLTYTDENSYAFVWDGSANETNGFVDASEEEVLIATFKVSMSEEQRTAYVAAGTPKLDLYDISAIENTEKFFDGTDYLVAVQGEELAIERIKAVYTAHSDGKAEITTADVTVKVTFDGKAGVTKANLGYLTVGNNDAVVIDAEGNEEETVEYVIKDATVGETITIMVEKNGYLTAEAEVTVSAQGDTVEITTKAGDIKDSTEDTCGDGKVDLSDFIRVVRAFSQTATEDYRNTVDINEDETANVTDLAVIKANFGKSCDDNTVIING